MDLLKVNHGKTNSGKPGAEEDEFWPLSGEPFFSTVLARSHVKPMYNMTVPVKIQKAINYCPCPVVLTYRGKKWNMSYQNKRFDPRWREFAFDNKLNAGDACVFEIVKQSKTLIEFRVQILRGGFPFELLEKDNGDTADTPIIIE